MTTTPANWHRFTDTDEGDEQCSRCAVVVDWEAHMTFTIPCPAGDCPSKHNPDRGCVFVPSKDSEPCKCIYCGRTGDRDHETDDDEAAEEIAEELDNDPLAVSLARLDSVGVGDVLTFNLDPAVFADVL